MILIKNLNHILKNYILLLLITCSFSIYSQKENDEQETNTFKGTISEKVKTKFNKPEIEIERSGLVSNVLNIINTSKENLNFTLDVLLPTDWNSIIDSEKIYSLPIQDTLYIPILLIPTTVKTGSSEIIVNTFLLDIYGEQIGDNSFNLKTKKKIKWDLEVKTGNKFYFKNDEFSKKFEYSIINRGNYKQDISVTHLIPKNDLIISDTTDIEKIIINDTSIYLDVGENADFSYNASAIQLNERNKRKISNTNYTPYKHRYFKKYDLIINSTEERNSSKVLYKKTAKVSFIKLPNEIEMQTFGYPSLPLTIDAYIQNILSDRPFMSINLRGLKQLSNDANLVYNTTLNFSQSYGNGNDRRDIPWYVGYFDDKKSIEIGQVFSNIIGIISSGDGIKSTYRLNEKNSLTGFFIKSKNNFQNLSNTSYGLTHNFYSSFFSLRTQYGRNENKTNQSTTDIVSLHPRVRIFKKTVFDFFISRSLTKKEGVSKKKEGFLYSLAITTSIAKKLKFNLNGRYTDPNFGSSTIERLNLSHRTNYQMSSYWSVFLNNNYQTTTSPANYNFSKFYRQELLFNRLAFSKRTFFGSIQNGLFYDVRNFAEREIHSRGISYQVSTFNIKNNFQSSYLLRAGYTQETLPIKTDNQFSIDFTTLIRYKIWNYTFKYNYGNFIVTNTQNTGGQFIVPQLFRASVQNQYTLKNRRFILETNTSYTYRNLSKNSSFGISPELFYFSKTNWRYSLQMSYFYNSTDYSDIITFGGQDNFNPNRSGKTQSSNLTIGMSIRKEIGIPIPYAKKKSSNIEFIVFKDVNGNGTKDKDEIPMNNVVINFGQKEIISSNIGVAKVNKIPFAKYPIKVLPLEDLKGWFPNISDSIYIGRDEKYFIPFVKGVKLYGDVIIDRQKIAITDESPIDMSRIKISATKDKVYSTLTDNEGHFEFYLPVGDYILTMDEGILSSNLRLSRNSIPIVLKNNQDGFYVSFYIIEKRRKVILRDFSKKKK